MHFKTDYLRTYKFLDEEKQGFYKKAKKEGVNRISDVINKGDI